MLSACQSGNLLDGALKCVQEKPRLTSNGEAARAIWQQRAQLGRELVYTALVDVWDLM
jgi:hypothetical protein